MKFLKTLLIFVDNNFTDLNSVLLLLSLYCGSNWQVNSQPKTRNEFV